MSITAPDFSGAPVTAESGMRWLWKAWSADAGAAIVIDVTNAATATIPDLRRECGMAISLIVGTAQGHRSRVAAPWPFRRSNTAPIGPVGQIGIRQELGPAMPSVRGTGPAVFALATHFLVATATALR